jgi:hypothetical protein
MIHRAGLVNRANQGKPVKCGQIYILGGPFPNVFAFCVRLEIAGFFGFPTAREFRFWQPWVFFGRMR